MRPFFAALITAALFIGVYSYTRFVESVRRPLIQVHEDFANEDYSLVVTRTFDCVGDVEYEIPAISIRFRDRLVFESDEPIPATRLIEEKLEDVAVGSNSIVVKAVVGIVATPSGDSKVVQTDEWGEPVLVQAASAATHHALRVQVLRGNETISDGTAWIGPGEDVITESFSFDSDTAVDSSDGTESHSGA